MSFSTEVTADAPSHWWRMGGTSSPVVNVGSVSGADMTVTGTFGADGNEGTNGAVTFDGTDDNGTATVTLSDTDLLTVELVFNVASYDTSDDLLIEFQGPWFNNNGGFVVDLNNSTGGGEANTVSLGAKIVTSARWTFPQSDVPAGQRNHLVFKIDRGAPAVRAFANGTEVTLTERVAATADSGGFNSGTLAVMSRNGASLFQAGVLDEVVLYKKLLSDARIAAHAAPLVAPPSGNVLYVNPAAGSDSYDYTQIQTIGTPALTLTRAAGLAQDGDTIKVVASATRAAFMEALGLIATDVTIEGNTGAWPAVGFGCRGLVRWTIKDAVTYGPTQAPSSYFYACEDMTFVDWEAQRGGANILAPKGSWLWDGGSVDAPLDGPSLGFLDGVGWRFFHTFESDVGVGDVEFRDHEWNNVQGEDGVQFLGGAFHAGTLKFLRCYWHDFTQSDQPGAPHTDGVQFIGADHVIFDSCKFERVPSMIISTNDIVQDITIVNSYFRGDPSGGYSTQFFGLLALTARNCTWEQSQAGGLRVGYDPSMGLINPVIDVGNCIIDKLTFTEGVGDPDADQAGAITVGDETLIGAGPTAFGGTAGFAEYGHTGAGDSLVILELANTPPGTNSLAIDSGVSHATDSRVPLLDRLGRARKGAGTDLGCHESDPAVAVTVDARAPRVISQTPTGTEESVGTNVVLTLFAKPGETIDAETVTDSTFSVEGPNGDDLPVSIAVGSPDGNGYQALTLDITGPLYPFARYTATATAGIEDSQGSGLASELEWSFTTAGPPGPAIDPGGEDPGEFTLSPDSRFHVGATVYCWRGGGGERPYSPTPVTSAVVAADSTTTFAGLDASTVYLAGLVVSGPFISFRT